MKKDPLIGKRLANFRIDRPLGRGGMAQVYYGIDTQLERPVAIKIIDARYQGDPEYARRFVDEAKMVARWRHENIVQVFYAGNVEDVYFFAMEYIEGVSLESLLESYLKDASLMPYEDVLRIGRAIAGALDYAHKQGIVHRDIKPSNIMISRDERVVLMDFGLALDMGQGSMGQVFGTPHYISPEQARKSSDAIAQSDIYSLGVVLYEMLTGAIPFDDPSAASVAVQHITMPPPSPTLLNPALNQEIEDVLLKALAKKPEERYSTATAMLDALTGAIASLGKAAKDSLVILPPALASKQPRLSRKSVADMIDLDLDGDDAETAKSMRAANPIHNLETQETSIVPKLTRPAKQARTSEFNGLDEKPTLKLEEAQKSGNGKTGLFIAIGSALIVVLLVAVVLLLQNMQNVPEILLDTGETETALAFSVSQTANLAPSLQATELAISETPMPSLSPEPSEDIQATANSISATETAFAFSATGTSVVLTNEAVLLANTSVAATNMAIEASNIEVSRIALTAEANNLVATTNAIPSPTDTLASTATNQVLATASPVATVALYPSGALIEMSYNNAGFYLRNSSDVTVRLSPLSFQALDANGNVVGNAFDGIDWTRFYNSVDRDGRCVAIELLDQSAWTRPNNCVAATGSAFNSLLTFPTNDQRIFWDGRNGATQFAVFWEDEEIGRCSISEGICLARVGTLSSQTLPTSVVSASTESLAPTTAAYPTGPLLEMSFNNAGFYLRNSSDVTVRLSPLRFQALDSTGNAVGNAFDGVDWTRFYNSVDRNGRCVAIELLDQSTWTRPNNCVAATGSAFNSLLTFPTNDQRIFWDGRNGATQFAVYWNGEEVGRCAIAEVFCQVRVGN